MLYLQHVKREFRMKKFWLFILAIFISFLPGIIGMIFSPSGMSDMWYNALAKSVLTPDGWVFAVVWPFLYLLLGIALYLIFIDKTKYSKAKAYWLFGVNMFLNALWSYVFFGLNFIGIALIVLIALIGFTIWMMRSFKAINHAAYWLIWPYLIWLIFALYLNGMVSLLN